MQVVRMIVER